MVNNYQILSEDAIKYLCGLIRDLASVSEGIDNINLADDKTFSNIYIKNLIDKCLEDANAEAEKLVGALTHLTCEETVIQPTLDNSEINVIYLYSADGNPPYQQFLKISEDKLVDLGSTSISLEDYIKAADVAKDYATKIELKAVTDKIGTTTLTTTDTTITGAIEEVKGIADGKAEILDSEKNDVNTWSSNKIANEIAEVETELNANLGELINDTKVTTKNTFSSDKIKAITNEIRKFILSKTDYQGVEAYPTECGVYRVVKKIDGMPNDANQYATLIIYGNGYFTHIYHDVISGRIWIGDTAESVKAPTWQELVTESMLPEYKTMDTGDANQLRSFADGKLYFLKVANAFNVVDDDGVRYQIPAFAEATFFKHSGDITVQFHSYYGTSGIWEVFYNSNGQTRGKKIV